MSRTICTPARRLGRFFSRGQEEQLTLAKLSDKARWDGDALHDQGGVNVILDGTH